MKFLRFPIFAVILVYLSSCASNKLPPNYFHSVTDTTGKGTPYPELVIQKDDQLSIQVYSRSTKPEVSDVMYNLPGGANASGAQSGFLVDVNGNIEYPRIGVIHAEGLTKLQLADLIKKKINENDSVLTNPSVIVRFMSMRITVLGEVNSQGLLNFPGEKITILQAIGLAGGINDFGLKDKVKVLREVDGKRQIGVIDLSSSNAFESPYYNLMQNDVVMVEPSSRRQKMANEELNLRRASFALSAITAIAVLYNIFR
ncbi:polysaccharide biosynthesis/export family protein [Terrimonas sp. NA20]|uniref:Polysaccharide biosynthesis/export family protein n=1 Tax=Terrimonas ginsenosidimutans TaxID=2908004 RepID=A0ABS9KNW3_9BACT|nr:polysaccharide biosynthesis/export family protein [Terrimonas ginsenosidimutans]MCG2613965.1 polysaccharide biosynthesis/export family protein [Terrimonas ginsenosidimutans]